MKRKVKRVLFAGTGSGSGKTTLVCGILQCLVRRGISPSAFKCGPDYIDPMFHQRVLGVPSGNLDNFFCNKDRLKYLLAENTGEGIAVIEGVMGYFDGIGVTENASSFSIADATDTPTVLIINCRGMAASIKALLKGYIEYEPKNQRHIKGVIFNMLPETFYAEFALYAESLGVKPLGFVPQKKELFLESRHLGLVTPEEIEGFKEKINTLADLLEKTVDINGLLALATNVTEIEYTDIWGQIDRLPRTVKVAVTKDNAFCFLYRDNLDFLEKAGCEIVYFSPLKDNKLPEQMDLLLLCGGYPELYAKELSENKTMRDSIQKWVKEERPCIAECGAFLYLQKELEDCQGSCYEMAGVFSDRGSKNQRLQNFGYIEMTAEQENLICKKGEVITAHEFHYWSCGEMGEGFIAKKPSNGKSWGAAIVKPYLYAGFPHIYYYGDKNMEKVLRMLQKIAE